MSAAELPLAAPAPLWPDPDFPPYSRSSRHWSEQAAEAGLGEVERTLAGWRGDPAGRRVLVAIRDDLADAHDGGAGVTWIAKVELLRAEIARRRRDWAVEIGDGTRTRADAVARLAALEGVQDRYFVWGWHMGLPEARAFEAWLAGRRSAAAPAA